MCASGCPVSVACGWKSEGWQVFGNVVRCKVKKSQGQKRLEGVLGSCRRCGGCFVVDSGTETEATEALRGWETEILTNREGN